MDELAHGDATASIIGKIRITGRLPELRAANSTGACDQS